MAFLYSTFKPLAGAETNIFQVSTMTDGALGPDISNEFNISQTGYDFDIVSFIV